MSSLNVPHVPFPCPLSPRRLRAGDAPKQLAFPYLHGGPYLTECVKRWVIGNAWFLVGCTIPELTVLEALAISQGAARIRGDFGRDIWFEPYPESEGLPDARSDSP